MISLLRWETCLTLNYAKEVRTIKNTYDNSFQILILFVPDDSQIPIKY